MKAALTLGYESFASIHHVNFSPALPDGEASFSFLAEHLARLDSFLLRDLFFFKDTWTSSLLGARHGSL